MCDIIIFPPLYEFGFPIVGGFASGFPFVTFSIPTISEVGGGAAMRCNSRDAEDLKNGGMHALSGSKSQTKTG